MHRETNIFTNCSKHTSSSDFRRQSSSAYAHHLRFSMINKVATTHCSFLRLQIKRKYIIDKCRECDKDRNIHNFTGCLYRVKQINLHLSEMEILEQPLSLPFIIENLTTIVLPSPYR
jgi:hypothetical protein